MARELVPCTIDIIGADYVVLTPIETLDSTTTYYITVTTNVKSTLDENLESQFNSQFTTGIPILPMYFMIENSWPDDYDFIDISVDDYFYLYFDYALDPSSVHGNHEGAIVTYGTPVTFTKENYEDIIDEISDAVHIKRDSSRGIYNSVTESSYDNVDYTSPADTEWNSDGWSILTNIKDRSYLSWAISLEYNPQEFLVDREMLMHIISEDRYFLVKFSSWTSGAMGGGFSYERTEVFATGGIYVEGNVAFLYDSTSIPCNLYVSIGEPQQVTITPNNSLLSDSVYTLQAKTGLKSVEGYYLDEQVDLSFTTEASTILYILWHSDDTDHYPSVRECSAITFDDHIVNNEMVEHGFVTDPDDVIVPGRWQRIEPTSRTYIYFTDVDFIEGAIYHLSVTPGIVSETGKILETGLEYDFNIRIL